MCVNISSGSLASKLLSNALLACRMNLVILSNGGSFDACREHDHAIDDYVKSTV